VFEQDDEILQRVAAHLKQPVQLNPALERRVLDEVSTLPVPRTSVVGALWQWMVTPRRIPISPLAGGGLALAAGLATLLLSRPWRAEIETAAPVAFEFVVVAPRAGSVSLVGDFNDWDSQRTPMTSTGGGVWTTVLPLAPGRYRYAFLIDGSEWLADPSAPAAGSDGFGAPSSVVTVGGA
jgi:hypothetical protein